MVNQIEYNVEHGVNFVTDGAKETEQANEYRQKSRKVNTEKTQMN